MPSSSASRTIYKGQETLPLPSHMALASAKTAALEGERGLAGHSDDMDVNPGDAGQ